MTGDLVAVAPAAAAAAAITAAAAAAAAVATTAAAAAAVATAAAAAASRALLRLIHAEGTTVEDGSVELLDGLGRKLGRAHGHEAEAAGLTAVAIHRNMNFVHLTHLC